MPRLHVGRPIADNETTNETTRRNIESMDARLTRIVLVLTAFSSIGATYRTPNFIVDAPTPEIAQQVAAKAEQCRVELAREWLEQTLPRWHKPCRVQVKVGRIGAGGSTTFAFDRGHVFGWRMNVQGPLDRILDSVLPHEVCHTILACHFRRPLPRWADEGAATLAEDESEKRRQKLLFEQVVKNRRKIPLRTLLSMKDYPRDMNNVLTLYAQGYSLADHLVQRGGKARYLKFVDFANTKGWDRAVAKFYGIPNVDTLDKQWSAWVVAGSPRLDLPAGQQLADAGSTKNRGPLPKSIVRSQNPDSPVDSRVHGPVGRARPRGMDLTAPDPRRPEVSQRAALVHSDHRKQSTGGEQNSRSGRITNWSDFPQRRIGSGSTRLGNVSRSSFSP